MSAAATGGEYHARRFLRQQRQTLAASYTGGLISGPASQALGPARASWARLLFLSIVDEQDKLSLKRFTGLVQHFGSQLTEEEVMPTFAAACNGATTLDWEGFCWWLGRVFGDLGQPEFIDGVEELIHSSLKQSSMLLRVHLTGEAHGDAPQLVAANPSCTVAEFQAMVAERLADEYGLAEVQVTALKSMQGAPLACNPQSTVRELVAEVGCVLSASISHASSIEIASLKDGQAAADPSDKIRPQLFGKPSIALQIYQKSQAEPAGEAQSAPRLLLVGPEQLYRVEEGRLLPAATHETGQILAAALLDGVLAVAAEQTTTVSFIGLEPGSGPEQCELGQTACGLFSVWEGTLVAIGAGVSMFSVDRHEARQLASLSGVDQNTVGCSDGSTVSYVTFDPEAEQPAQLWQVGNELCPQLRTSAKLPQPRAVVWHAGTIYIFASGLYKVGSDAIIRQVQLTGPDAFIVHSVTCAVSDGNSIYAVSGANAAELWEISKEGTCSFVSQIPASIKAIIHEQS